MACMLFDYVAPDLPPGNAGAVWSQFPLQPLAPGLLTPFSHSVLSELTSRAWYIHYDRLGFAPTPRSRLVRRYKGHVYFNISLAAQMESTHAGLEPLALQINQQRHPLATWEKPGFLAGFKMGRAQKKIDELLDDYSRQMRETTETARAWYFKTQGLRWSQAEILQIMEEIERVGVNSMAAYLSARHALEYLYAGLLAEMKGKLTATQALLLINNALCDLQGLVEITICNSLLNLAERMREPSTLAWLKAGEFADWANTLPSKQAAEQIAAFTSDFGHRTIHEGEIANSRWTEEPGIVLRAVLAQIESQPGHPHKDLPRNANSVPLQKLLEALPASSRKQGEQRIQRICDLHKLQSNALHSLAYIWSGTRTWALAAAREAMADKRLLSEDEVFFFELEEIKQMMTGEWNISSVDEIRATLAQRRVEQTAAQQEIAPDILVGNTEGQMSRQETSHGILGVAGQAAGPLRHWGGTEQESCSGAVLASELLDSGHALALPLAIGFVSAAGTPLDPFVAAASAWQHPVIVGMGKSYADLAEGVYTAVDANSEAVTVRQ
jgi:hypothetical protein